MTEEVKPDHRKGTTTVSGKRYMTKRIAISVIYRNTKIVVLIDLKMLRQKIIIPVFLSILVETRVSIFRISVSTLNKFSYILGYFT